MKKQTNKHRFNLLIKINDNKVNLECSYVRMIEKGPYSSMPQAHHWLTKNLFKVHFSIPYLFYFLDFTLS